jgi:2-oxoglutarate/2-oxoacid ferredoxin oxidoreductase subunit alpha
MPKNSNSIELPEVVIKFAGDSGDGMQFSGTMFSENAAFSRRSLATFPDFPAEIRAPHNTIAGVSGFQVRIGSYPIYTPGDLSDVLVASNPASLKSNLKWLRKGAIIIVDSDAFNEKAFEKCGYCSNPLEDGTLNGYELVKVPITRLTDETLKDLNLDNKIVDKSRNMFALGVTYFLFNMNLDRTLQHIESKFKKKAVMEANKLALMGGYEYALNQRIFKNTYTIPAAQLEKGKYRLITGNIAAAWGLIAASEQSGFPLYLSSYPITPATDILVELSKHKELGVKVFQAEDEIASICSAIGASFTGTLAVTTTSGPGFSLKSEALGLAVMTELPLVIIDVQRGGPSTGLPTKTEQSDLMQALFGRNGECPLVVMAASSPGDNFYMAYKAAKTALEHMTPVILLSDGFIANGSQLFAIPEVDELSSIQPPIACANDSSFKPYERDENTLVRKWALPGTEGLRHRVGGLEKENLSGNVSTDPQNHELMVSLRAEKIERIAKYIPEQELLGEEKGKLLVVSWGGTKGSVFTAVETLQKEGYSISHAHFNFILPLPLNTMEIFSGFEKIIVCELNSGQFANYLRMKCPGFSYLQLNKVQGLPFTISELSDAFVKILKEA